MTRDRYPVAEELRAAHAHQSRFTRTDGRDLVVARGVAIHVEAQRQLVRTRQVVLNVPRQSCQVVDAGESCGRACLQDLLEGSVDGRSARRRHNGVDKIHRVIGKYSRRTPEGIPDDRATGRRLRRARDVRSSQRGAVNPYGVAGDVVGARRSADHV